MFSIAVVIIFAGFALAMIGLMNEGEWTGPSRTAGVIILVAGSMLVAIKKGRRIGVLLLAILTVVGSLLWAVWK